jgi:hypothetical protein
MAIAEDPLKMIEDAPAADTVWGRRLLWNLKI